MEEMSTKNLVYKVLMKSLGRKYYLIATTFSAFFPKMVFPQRNIKEKPKSIKMRIMILALMLCLQFVTFETSQAQERFEFKSGSSEHTSNIQYVAGIPMRKPYVITLVYELEQTKKEKKQKKKFTNEISFEINQLNELWIYGFGGLDGQYNFETTLGDNRDANVKWVPASIFSSNTIPAEIKSAKLSVSYFRDKRVSFNADLDGSIEIDFVNADGEKEYKYNITYSSKRTLVVSILKDGKAVVLNPTSERRSSNAKILGEILKIKTRDGF